MYRDEFLTKNAQPFFSFFDRPSDVRCGPTGVVDNTRTVAKVGVSKGWGSPNSETANNGVKVGLHRRGQHKGSIKGSTINGGRLKDICDMTCVH